MDKRVDSAQGFLTQAAQGARHASIPLEDLFLAYVQADFPPWYSDILETACIDINATKGGKGIKNVEPLDVHGFFEVIVYLIEVYGEVDISTADLKNLPQVSLSGLREARLNEFHGPGHGAMCYALCTSRGIKNAGRATDGEQVERVHSVLNATISRVASAGVATFKSSLAELMRHIAEMKLDRMAASIAKSVKRSKNAFPKAAWTLASLAKELTEPVRPTPPKDEIEARKLLCTSASTVTDEDSAVAWAAQAPTIMALDIVVAGHMQRLRDFKGGPLNNRALRDLVRQLVLLGTASELATALAAVQNAAGDDVLSAETAANAIRLSVGLPANTTPIEVCALKPLLRKAHCPSALFDEDDSSPGTVNGLDVQGLILWTAIRMGMSDLVTLIGSIREKRMRIYSKMREERVSGAAGGYRKTKDFKADGEQSKKGAAWLHSRARHYNTLVDKVDESIKAWCTKYPNIEPAPAILQDLPARIDETQLKSLDYALPDVGMTKRARIDVALVDAYRHYRSHYEEATTTGVARATSLIDLFTFRESDLQARLAAAVALDANLRMEEGHVPTDEVLANVFPDAATARLLQKHLPHTMKVPSDEVCGTPITAGNRAGRQLLVSGYKAELSRAHAIAADDLVRARVTLHAITGDLTPIDSGANASVGGGSTAPDGPGGLTDPAVDGNVVTNEGDDEGDDDDDDDDAFEDDDEDEFEDDDEDDFEDDNEDVESIEARIQTLQARLLETRKSKT